MYKYIMFSNFLPENRDVYEITWELMTVGQTTDDSITWRCKGAIFVQVN